VLPKLPGAPTSSAAISLRLTNLGARILEDGSYANAKNSLAEVSRRAKSSPAFGVTGASLASLRATYIRSLSNGNDNNSKKHLLKSSSDHSGEDCDLSVSRSSEEEKEKDEPLDSDCDSPLLMPAFVPC